MRDDDLAAGVVLAGGSGTRLGAAGNKVYLPLRGRPILSWSLRAFADAGVRRLVLVVRPQDRGPAEDAVRHAGCPITLVHGGTNRHESEHNALVHLGPDIEAGHVDAVAIHDGARPLVTPDLVRASLAAGRRYGAAVPGVAIHDVTGPDLPGPRDPDVPDTPGDAGTAPRLVRVQTPQAFRALPLLRAYQQAAVDGFAGTDTAACVERYAGFPVHHFDGDVRNVKVTYQVDLAVAEALAGAAGN